ncbi:MAG: FkbM family methyltransferase [Candidatus Aenigmarchaeota archaeon]|nr:FkbM family methyltransferase [Candidatus Aenigmarchaeota archaeon]
MYELIMLPKQAFLSILDLWVAFYDIPGYLKKYTLKKGDVVIDAGAYLGNFSKYASERVGEAGKVIAFEPDPENFKKLKQNLIGFKNVILVQKGLFDFDGKITLNRNPIFGSLASSVIDNKGSKYSFKISVATLDNEIKRLGLPSVDFIKMDIEGAELEAFKGMEQTLDKYHPNLAIACYHLREGKETHIHLKKILSKHYSEIKIGNLFHKTLFAERRDGL